MFVLVIVFSGLAVTAKAVSSGNDWTARSQLDARPSAATGISPLTPAQIINAYDLTSTTNGAGTTIAIVDAYNDPTVASDLNSFSTNFQLPTANFVEHEMAPTISTDGGWALEISLDVEWAHAIAPDATILLVEARSSSLSDLLSAVNYAASYPGVVAVSMSWGGSEFPTEHNYDSYFSKTGVVFFASAGDNGAGVIWPSSSPNVVSVGGTTLNLDTTGAFVSETSWSGGGGGVSAYEQQPAHQTNYGLSYAKRSIPDVSYDADPNTGVMVYDSTPYDSATGWWTVGGTSAGAPQWAAIQALGLSTGNSNFYLDAAQSYSAHFRDIMTGSNGYPAAVGYDLATGLGSPITTNFKPQATPDFSLSASPSSLTIRSGSSGSMTITVSSLNGFTGTVSLSSKASNGLTANLSPTSITNSGASMLKITISKSIRSGTYPVTVTGISGSLTHSITVQVTVG